LKKYAILLAITFITLNGYCQDISGFWTWEEPGKSFEIELEQKNSSSWSGYHSGVFHNGNKIDGFVDENSIYLTKVSTNIYEGTIKSSFSLKTYKVRITFNLSNNSIEWYLFGENTGEFYFPRKVTMVRVGHHPGLKDDEDELETEGGLQKVGGG